MAFGFLSANNTIETMFILRRVEYEFLEYILFLLKSFRLFIKYAIKADILGRQTCDF